MDSNFTSSYQELLNYFGPDAGLWSCAGAEGREGKGRREGDAAMLNELFPAGSTNRHIAEELSLTEETEDGITLTELGRQLAAFATTRIEEIEIDEPLVESKLPEELLAAAAQRYPDVGQSKRGSLRDRAARRLFRR